MLPFQMRRGHKFAAPFVHPLPDCSYALIPIKGQGNLSRGHSHNWQFAVTCAPDLNSSGTRKRAPQRCTNDTHGREHTPVKRHCKHRNAIQEQVRTAGVLSGEAAQLPSETIKNPTVSPHADSYQQSVKWVN